MSADLRLAAATAAGRAVSAASRVTGRGAGRSMGGRFLMALDPAALRKLASGRRIILVSGTNGKTTTTALTAAAIGPGAATNSGVNLPRGLAWALAEHRDPVMVLEVDELYLPRLLPVLQPNAVIALNLTRDQLDRTHEVHRLAQLWGDAFADSAATLIANRNDPLVVAAASRAGRARWVDAPARWMRDAAVCPRCDRLLDRNGERWSCRCGLRQPAADVRVDGRTVWIDGVAVPLRLALPGEDNVGNAAFALTAAALLGVSPAEATGRLAAIRSVDGRYAQLQIAGRSVRLLLAKNPAGWEAALQMLRPSAQLAFGINARGADGRDPSWLWDVPFERMRDRTIAVFGERGTDLAVRLHYAGVPVIAAPDLLHAVSGLPEGPVDVVANYTAFHDIVRHEGRLRHAA